MITQILTGLVKETVATSSSEPALQNTLTNGAVEAAEVAPQLAVEAVAVALI